MFRHLSIRCLATVCFQRTCKKLPEFNTKQPKIPSYYPELLIVRHKYITSGVQGRRSSKLPPKKVIDEDEDYINDSDEADELSLKDIEYEAIASEALGRQNCIRNEENILVIQPYIKWGPNKSDVSPDIKLQEAKDLIHSLDAWSISESIKVPLVGYGKRTFFGRGKVDELRKLSKKYNYDPSKKV